MRGLFYSKVLFVLKSMYRLGLVDMLVTHANMKGFGLACLEPSWLYYASSVKNKSLQLEIFLPNRNAFLSHPLLSTDNKETLCIIIIVCKLKCMRRQFYITIKFYAQLFFLFHNFRCLEPASNSLHL